MSTIRLISYLPSIVLAALVVIQAPAFGQVEPVDFGKQIYPILRKNCIACHNTKQKEGGLLLESHAALIQGGDSGPAVPAKKDDENFLLARVTANDDSLMPPPDNKVGAKKLTTEEIALLRRWIEEGAKPGSPIPSETIVWQPLPENVKPIYSVAVSPDGQYAACGRANQVVLYQWPSRKELTSAVSLIDPSLFEPNSKMPPAAHRDIVQSLAFSPDGEQLAAGGFRCVKIWRRQTEPVVQFEGGGILSATRDGSLIAMTAQDNIIEIYSGRTLRKLFMLRGKYGPVSSVAWSASGDWLVASDLHGRLAAWRMPTISLDQSPEKIAELRSVLTASVAEPLRGLSLNGSELIAGITPTGKLQVVRLLPAGGAPEKSPEAAPNYTIEQVNMLAEHSDVIAVEALGAAPMRWIVASRDGWIRIANAKSGEVLSQWAHGSKITAMAISSLSDRLLTSGADGVCKLWNAADGKPIANISGDYRSNILLATAERTLARQKSLVERLTARIPDLEKVAQAETDAKNKAHEARDKVAQALAAKDKEIAGAIGAIAEAEKTLADAKKAAEEAAKRVEQMAVDLETKKKAPDSIKKSRQETEAELAKMEQSLAVFVQSAEKAAKAIPDQRAIVEREKTLVNEAAGRVEKIKAAQATNSVAISALITPDNQSIVTTHADHSVRITRAQDGQQVAVLRGLMSAGNSIAYGANHQIFAATNAGDVAGWDLALPWRLERTIGGEDQPLISDRVTALDFSPDGRLLAIGSGPPSRSGELRTFSVADGSLAGDFPSVHSDTVLGVRFAPEGQRLLSCGADKQIRVFDLAAKKLLRTLEGHTHHVLGAVWHDDGETIASASADNSIKIWDVATGEQKRTINVGSKEVSSVAFIGQTSQLVSVSADQQARLYDLGNGRSIRSFSGATDALFSVVVTLDSMYVVAGGQDGSLLLWTTDKGELVQKLQ